MTEHSERRLVLADQAEKLGPTNDVAFLIDVAWRRGGQRTAWCGELPFPLHFPGRNDVPLSPANHVRLLGLIASNPVHVNSRPSDSHLRTCKVQQ